MFSTKTLITLQPIDRFFKFQCLLHTGQFQLMSRQGRFCPQCHVKVDLEWHPQIPCFCLNKDTKVLSNLFICQLFYVIHVPLHHVRHIHLLLLCQAANMSRKRADKSCGHGKIIPIFPAISQSAQRIPNGQK